MVMYLVSQLTTTMFAPLSDDDDDDWEEEEDVFELEPINVPVRDNAIPVQRWCSSPTFDVVCLMNVVVQLPPPPPPSPLPVESSVVLLS